MNALLNIRTNRLLLLAFVLVLAVLSSCKKESSAPPEIQGVRLVDSTKRDSTFTEALPGTLIAVLGANFDGLKAVYFNNVSAPFNSALATNSSIIVTIPESAPTEATDPDVSNQLKVVTDHGEATYDFILVAPPPAISRMTNEMALPGQEVTIYGSNFYILDKVVFPGNMEVTSFTVNSEATSLTVTVPAGLTESGRIEIVNKFGTAVSPFYFNDSTTGVLCNFDNVANFSWGCDVKSDPAPFPGGHGSYAQMTFSGVPGNDWSWWTGGRSMNSNAAEWVPASMLSDNIDNWALKFEVYVKEPWGAGSFFIVKDYDWKFVGLYAPWKAAGTEFKSTGWHTVTIPLAQWRSDNGTGDTPSSLADLVGSGSGGIDIMFINDGDTPVDNFNAAVDNIRIIKTK